MIVKLILFIGVVSLGVLIGTLSSTTPSLVHPVVILGVFILIYFVTVAVFLVLLRLGYIAISRVKKKPATVTSIHTNVLYYYASALALAPVIFIAMQSVGRLSPYEASLIVFFEVLACVYIAKRI